MTETSLQRYDPPIDHEARYTQVNYYNQSNGSESDLNDWKGQSMNINVKLQRMILDQGQEIQRLQDHINDLKKSFGDKMQNVDKEISNMKMRIKELQTEVDRYRPGELTFEISKIKNQKSDSFYNKRNGYKMRLQLDVTSYWLSNEFSIKLQMANNPDNEKLPWPMEFDVRLGLVDQKTDRFYDDEKQVVRFETLQSVHETPFIFNISKSVWKNRPIVFKCFVD